MVMGERLTDLRKEKRGMDEVDLSTDREGQLCRLKRGRRHNSHLRKVVER